MPVESSAATMPSVVALREFLIQNTSSEISLRDECDDDSAFLCDLYASTREAELAPVPWSAEQKKTFLADQFRLQRTHYRTHFGDAGFWLLSEQANRIGRLYMHMGKADLRIMDISLATHKRGMGLGTQLIGLLQNFARQHDQFISLHVEPFNPALALYKKLGFEQRKQEGIYWMMTWGDNAIY